MVFGVGSAQSSRVASSADLQSEGLTQESPGSLTLPAGFRTAPSAGQGAAYLAKAAPPESQPGVTWSVPQQPQHVQVQPLAPEQQESQPPRSSSSQQQEAVGGTAAPQRLASREPAYKPPDILVRRHAAVRIAMTVSLITLNAARS
jgi:hypothetical protein